MKYVIFEKAAGGLFAVLGLGIGANHDALAAGFTSMRPVSAGRVRFSDTGLAEVYGHSESLNLVPHADDARFLTAFYRTETGSAPSFSAQKISA